MPFICDQRSAHGTHIGGSLPSRRPVFVPIQALAEDSRRGLISPQSGVGHKRSSSATLCKMNDDAPDLCSPDFTPSRAWKQAARPVLLTFDDGPCEATTPQILDTLREFRLHAVFFVIGQRLEKASNRELVRRMIDHGHTVGNHSYTHPNLARLTSRMILQEMEHTQLRLEELGVQERLFRPPYGATCNSVLEAAFRLRLWGLGWNIDPSDWDLSYPPKQWIDRACARLGKTRESIVLLHDIQESTAAGLRTFIDRLFSLGCSFPPLLGSSSPCVPDPALQWRRLCGNWKFLPGLKIYCPEL